MLSLQWPWLLLLLPLPLIVRALSKPPSEQAVRSALRVPFYHQLMQLRDRESLSIKSTKSPLVISHWLLWLSLLAAASGPQWVGEPQALPSTGRDLMLAVDISGSMAQQDMKVQGSALPRITVVKAVVNEFVRQRQGDKLGLILFGSRAYIQSPLSFDLVTLGQLMEEAEVGFAGKQTAIGDAIGFAIKRLRKRPENSRVVILLTDGADTASTLPPLEAAAAAQRENIRIYTIGVGATEMVKRGFFGTGLGAKKINPSADLDEKTLREIAHQTGGEYYRARNTEELQAAYNAIAALEPIEQEQQQIRPRRSLLHWPLTAALIAALAIALAQRRSQ